MPDLPFDQELMPLGVAEFATLLCYPSEYALHQPVDSCGGGYQRGYQHRCVHKSGDVRGDMQVIDKYVVQPFSDISHISPFIFTVFQFLCGSIVRMGPLLGQIYGYGEEF